jgi:Lysozyme inhibitor LprI
MKRIALILSAALALTPCLLAQTQSPRCLQADKDLNEVYRQLRGSLNDLEKIQLRNTQRAWILQRDAQIAKSRNPRDKETAFYQTTKERVHILQESLRDFHDFRLPAVSTPVKRDGDRWINCITNGPCAVPNLGDGYHVVKLIHGAFQSNKRGDEESVTLDPVVFGTMDDREMAVGVLSCSTGGSGIFTHLMLY